MTGPVRAKRGMLPVLILDQINQLRDDIVLRPARLEMLRIQRSLHVLRQRWGPLRAVFLLMIGRPTYIPSVVREACRIEFVPAEDKREVLVYTDGACINEGMFALI